MVSKDFDNTSQRKADHLKICIQDDVKFKKSAGFNNYEFINNCIPELNFSEIDLSTLFFEDQISYPFLISCMTGGVEEADNINAALAEVAKNLNIPIGVGSQRQALENKQFIKSYKVIKERAGQVPILGNIGAAQIASKLSYSDVQKLIDMVNASALVVHLNPSQELIQKGGEPNFKNLLNNIERLVKDIQVPIIAKEVGSGIDKKSAKKLLEVGVAGIDVAGAGGTSWNAVEMIRNQETIDNYFWDWGLPTSYCIKKIKKLKNEYKFSLIGSGGITNGIEIAKAIALGADITASARPLLCELDKKGADGVTKLLLFWFDTLKKIMFLTGSKNIKELQNSKLLLKKDLF